MKTFYLLALAILVATCTGPKYEKLIDAEGLFTALESNEIISIETSYFGGNIRGEHLVFREGAIAKVEGGVALSRIELAALDSFIKSVNSRNPGENCSVYGNLIIIKTLVDGSVRRYRGAFDICNPEEQSILLDVFGEPDD